jgi:hypothetical protein
MNAVLLQHREQAADLADQIESSLAKLTSDVTVWRSLTHRFEVDLINSGHV